MSKTQLGLGIIGCGMIGNFHINALSGVPDFQICGVWDVLPDAAHRVAKSRELKVYHTFEELLGDPAIQVVDICLPSGLHAEYGCRAAKAGKHVIVEKPMDITSEAARRLIETCRQFDRFLAVILQNRFAPSVLKVKEALNKGVLGRLIAGEATIKWFRNEQYYGSSQWKGTKKLDGGGALINQGIHTIDLFLWLLGEVKSMTSIVRTARHQIEVEDLALVISEFNNGAVGTITCSTAFKPGYPERIELYTEKGSVALEAGRIVRWDIDGTESADYLDAAPSGSGSSDPGAIPSENHQAQFKAIAAAILRGEQPPIGGEEAIRALEFILNIYDANGKWVRF